jgi:hypothetical protein
MFLRNVGQLLATWFHAGFLLNLFFRPWRWRRHVPPKRRLTLNELHGVISQKMVLFTTTAVRTSNPVYISIYIFLSLELPLYLSTFLSTNVHILLSFLHYCLLFPLSFNLYVFLRPFKTPSAKMSLSYSASSLAKAMSTAHKFNTTQANYRSSRK